MSGAGREEACLDTPLCPNELHATYDDILEQFALELLIGADKKLYIVATTGSIAA
jgi:hypothetical protein